MLLTRDKARRGPAVPLSGDQWAGIEVTAERGSLTWEACSVCCCPSVQDTCSLPAAESCVGIVILFCFALNRENVELLWKNEKIIP